MATDDAKTGARKLTQKQERFAQEYIRTGCASTAYRNAYNAHHQKNEGIWVNACKMLKKPSVQLRIKELRDNSAEKAVLSRAWVLASLMRNAEQGFATGDLTASNKALELLGKTDEMQMFLERSSVTSDNRHHHSAEPLSPFAEHLAEVLGNGIEDPPEGSLPN